MNNYTVPTEQAGTADGKAKKGHRRWIIPTSVGMVALFMGVGIGGSGSSEEATAAEPEPAPTVTETAEPEPAPTVTETAEPEVETITEEIEVEVEKEVTPQACLDALDAGDHSIDLLIQGLDISAEAMHAASVMDVAAIDQATADLEAITPDMEDAGFDWGMYSEACRSN